MSDYEHKKLRQNYMSMMSRCICEVEDLRREIARLQPKAEAYDRLGIVLNLLPRPSVGMSEDIVWRLKKEIDLLEAEMKKEEQSQ